MKTKLTLTIDDAIVRKAKLVAEKESISLSSTIERFLEDLTTRYSENSVVDSSRGILKNAFSTMSDEEIRAGHYKEKYGV